ncbi:tyrosine-type recombinase/integrase [Sciscionella marina]|uniref:tyrosine-type recombinase/integrase n=1 Tax=Sciscionella marina TaxID=508770 RepID=UPI00035E7BA8|nr:tyrosine-type recombinase/integrase [Sciscionella marina]
MGAEASVNVLVAEFRSWLAVDRGLSPETARCYGTQAGKFLAGLPEPVDDAVRQLDSRRITTFMVGYYRPLNGSAVRAIMGRACAHADLPRVGAHRLRHSLASDMLRAGASLQEVGQVLRHRSHLSTTIYAKVDENALRPLARPWPIEVRS